MSSASPSELALFAHELGSYSEPWIRAGNAIAECIGAEPANVEQLIGKHSPTDIGGLYGAWRDRLDTSQQAKVEVYANLQLAFEEYELIFRSIRRANRHSLGLPKGVEFLGAGSFANAYLYDPPNDSPKALRFALDYPVFDVLARTGAFVHTQDLPTIEKAVAINFRGQTVADYIPGTRIEWTHSEDVVLSPSDLRQVVVDVTTADDRKVGYDATGRGNMLFDAKAEHRLHLIDLGGIAGRGFTYRSGTNLVSVARSLLLAGDVRYPADYPPEVKKIAESLIAVCAEHFGADAEETRRVKSFIERHQGAEGKARIKRRELVE